MGARVRIGPFTVINQGVQLDDDVEIGSHVEIGGNGGDVIVGAGSRIAKGACLRGDIRLGRGVEIAQNAVLDGRIVLGDTVRIGASVLLTAHSEVGEGSEIYNHCSIGTLSQHPAFGPPQGHVVIGVRTTIREFCTVQIATEARATSIGDGCYLMSGCRINHDCEIGDDVKMADGVILAGTVTVGDHSYFGMGCAVHQRIRIGAFTMIGMNATIVRHVPPYATVIDRGFAKINRIGMRMRGATGADMAAVEAYFRTRSGDPAASPWIARIVDFDAACAGQAILQLRSDTA